MTHSPLPWRIEVHAEETDYMEEYHEPRQILDSESDLVADNKRFYPQPVTPADQALIVRAVNAHESLVAALRDIQARTTIKPSEPLIHPMNIVGEVNDISTAALELAGAQ